MIFNKIMYDKQQCIEVWSNDVFKSICDSQETTKTTRLEVEEKVKKEWRQLINTYGYEYFNKTTKNYKAIGDGIYYEIQAKNIRQATVIALTLFYNNVDANGYFKADNISLNSIIEYYNNCENIESELLNDNKIKVVEIHALTEEELSVMYNNDIVHDLIAYMGDCGRPLEVIDAISNRLKKLF